MLFAPEQISTESLFNLNIAFEMAYHSNLAYEKFEEDVLLLETPLKKEGFRLIKTFNHDESKTQAYLAVNHQYKVLCFRGTECDFMDIITDLKARLKDGGHEGFFSAFGSIKNEIILALKDSPDLPLYVTGHSLGGALAKVAVQDLIESKIDACYTFGSPAICTKEKVKDCKTPVFLVVNSADIVPRCLSIASGLVMFLILFLFLTKLVLKIMHSETSKIETWIEFLKILGTDTPKYVHFGEIHYLDDEGKISVLLNQKDSENIFMKIISKDFGKTIEDHKMIYYMNKIDLLKKGINE